MKLLKKFVKAKKFRSKAIFSTGKKRDIINEKDRKRLQKIIEKDWRRCSMLKKTVEVKLTDGLIAKASAMFVQKANRYTSDIYLERAGEQVDAKSIMGLMTLSIAPGDEITIIANGIDEEIALNDLVTFVTNDEVS